MSENNELTPPGAAETARNLLLFTLCLCDGIAKGKIPYALFQGTLDIVASDKNIFKTQSQWKPEHIDALTENLKISVLGVVFLVLDQELDSVFKDKPDKYSNSDLDALRAIIFMLRCAYSHTTKNPRWNVTSDIYKNVFKIDAIDFEMDFSNLNGELISLDLDWEKIFPPQKTLMN